MSGTKTHVTPLESHKRLLIAESELNRAQMIEDMAALRSDVRSLAEGARSLGTIVSSAASLVTSLAAFSCGKPAPAEAKPSWFQTILKGAGLVSSLWSRLRPSDPKKD